MVLMMKIYMHNCNQFSFSEMGGSHPSTSASGSSNLRCCDESESEPEVLELPRFLELEHLSSSHDLVQMYWSLMPI